MNNDDGKYHDLRGSNDHDPCSSFKVSSILEFPIVSFHLIIIFIDYNELIGSKIGTTHVIH